MTPQLRQDREQTHAHEERARRTEPRRVRGPILGQEAEQRPPQRFRRAIVCLALAHVVGIADERLDLEVGQAALTQERGRLRVEQHRVAREEPLQRFEPCGRHGEPLRHAVVLHPMIAGTVPRRLRDADLA